MSKLKKTDFQLAAELLVISNAIPRLEARMALLTDHFILRMKEKKVSWIQYNQVSLSITEGTRSEIDENALSSIIGQSTLQQFYREYFESKLSIKLVTSIKTANNSWDSF